MLGIRIPLCYLSEIVGKDVCVRGNPSHTACHISAWDKIEINTHSITQGGVTPIDSISHSCDCTQSTVNGQTAQIGAVNGQSGVKKTVNVRIPVRNGLDYSTIIHSEPVGWVYTCTERLFPDIQLADSGCSSNIETSLRAKYLSGQRSMAKN